MAVRPVGALQQYLGRLCDGAAATDDDALLERFVGANDRDAFALLIARHGPMVLGTARRLVDDAHDADDVFQAVFLSLARLAKSIRHGRTLPAWLHRTTARVAAKVRARRPRLAPPSEPVENRDPAAGLLWREVSQALDEELQRLPERLRSPLLLCYLSGLSRDEAARQLGWSLGTLKRRLDEGRRTLRLRLERRGIAAAGLALAVLAPDVLQAAVSPALLDASLGWIFATKTDVPAAISGLVLAAGPGMKGLVMNSLLALLAAVGVGVGIYAGVGKANPQKNADGKMEDAKPADNVAQADDPLPDGSTLRFGTSRFRHGIPILTMAVSADGKSAVACNGDHMPGAARVFDLTTGRELYTIERSSGPSTIEAAAISPDGRTIVTKQDFSLRIRDAATGNELRKIDLPRANSYSQNGWVAFTPDGRAVVATSQGSVIHLIDVETGKTIRDFRNENPEFVGWESVVGIAFSADGKRMALGGYNREKGNYYARLLDVDTGKELRRYFHGPNGYGIGALAFSPDAKLLATAADEGILRLFDVETGTERKAFPKNGGRLRQGSVTWSPDGKTVAVAGESIRLYDASTGEERLRIDRKTRALVFTDGGKTLTGSVRGAIYRWDAATGKVLTPEGGDSIVEQVLVSADGRRVVTRGQDGDTHNWDGATGQHQRALTTAWQDGLALSPDGRYLVWPLSDPSVTFTVPQEPGTIYNGARLRLYDIAADKFVDRFAGFKGNARDLTFTDGGKRLVSVDHRGGMVRIWNVETGTEERSFQAVPAAEQNQPPHVWRTALSRDGTTLAVAYAAAHRGGGLAPRNAPHLVRLWDVAGGREKQTLDGHRRHLLDLAFSPDGRWLASASEREAFVWEAATGQRAAALPNGLPAGASAVAFSSDGHHLAVAVSAGSIQIWEVATGTLRNEFKGHRDRATALTFAPQGHLLSGSLDTTVLAWDMRPPRVAAGSLETAWADLAKPESSEAFKAQGRLVGAPAEAVKFLADKIKPVEPPDAKRIQQLLADLDSAKFADREAASQALTALGQQAKPFLEAAVAGSKSAEFQVRARRILDGLKKLTPQDLRQIRSVQALKWIDDAAARSLLRQWAGGLKGAQLTEDASAALQRLEGAKR